MNPTAAANKAQAALRKNGMQMMLQKITRSDVYDVAVGGYPQTIIETSFFGVKTNISLAGRASGISESQRSGLIFGTDQIVLMPGFLSPEAGDLILINDNVWRIASIETVSPSGISILHKCQITKAVDSGN